MAGFSGFAGVPGIGSRSLSVVRFAERSATDENALPSYWLLLAFIFLLYLNVPIVMPAVEVVHPAKLVGGVALVAIFAETMFGRRRFSFSLPEGGWLLGFLAIATVSCLTALWPRHAVEKVSDLMKMALIYFFVANSVVSARQLRGVMWTMIFGGLVPAAGVLRNYLHGNIIEGRTAWVGIFENPNDLAYSLVILVPLAAFLAARSGWLARMFLLATILFYSAAVFVTFSRGGLIGLAAVIALYAWRQRSIVVRSLIVLTLTAGLILATRYWTRGEDFSDLQSDNSFQLRLATSEAGVAMFSDHPLLGVGPGCSLIAWPLYAPTGIYARGALITHNTFIEALSETGIIGFICFMAFLGLAIRHAHKLARREPSGEIAKLAAGLEIALWGFAVCGLSNGNVYTWFLYILVGLVSAASRIRGTQAI